MLRSERPKCCGDSMEVAWAEAIGRDVGFQLTVWGLYCRQCLGDRIALSSRNASPALLDRLVRQAFEVDAADLAQRFRRPRP